MSPTIIVHLLRLLLLLLLLLLLQLLPLNDVCSCVMCQSVICQLLLLQIIFTCMLYDSAFCKQSAMYDYVKSMNSVTEEWLTYWYQILLTDQ